MQIEFAHWLVILSSIILIAGSVTYVLGLIAALLTIPSVPTWDIENSAFLIYLIALNAIIIAVLYRKKFKS
jgi:uncharacterized membrane protein